MMSLLDPQHQTTTSQLDDEESDLSFYNIPDSPRFRLSETFGGKPTRSPSGALSEGGPPDLETGEDEHEDSEENDRIL
jgi:hypothetical protein